MDHKLKYNKCQILDRVYQCKSSDARVFEMCVCVCVCVCGCVGVCKVCVNEVFPLIDEARCVRMTALYAWGANSHGQLGLGYVSEQVSVYVALL